MIEAFAHLRATLANYSLLPEVSWQGFIACCNFKRVAKGELIYPFNQVPTSFCFLHKGLARAYVTDRDGNEFNKNFFAQGRFPGSMSALLNNQANSMAVEAIETCDIIEINFKLFRSLLFADPAVMKMHILYLERHWLLEKEPKEISYLQLDAKERYRNFLNEHAQIVNRLPQYHIASYLGITPTQLSRIRKQL